MYYQVRYVDDDRLPAQWAVACDDVGALIFIRRSAATPQALREARAAAQRLLDRRRARVPA